MNKICHDFFLFTKICVQNWIFFLVNMKCGTAFLAAIKLIIWFCYSVVLNSIFPWKFEIWCEEAIILTSTAGWELNFSNLLAIFRTPKICKSILFNHIENPSAKEIIWQNKQVNISYYHVHVHLFLLVCFRESTYFSCLFKKVFSSSNFSGKKNPKTAILFVQIDTTTNFYRSIFARFTCLFHSNQ